MTQSEKLARRLQTAKSRFIFMLCGFMICYMAVGLRLTDLILVKPIGQATTALAEQQPPPPGFAHVVRANITDRHHELMATSLKMQSVYADTTLIEDVPALATQIQEILPTEKLDVLTQKLSSGRKFIWLRRDVTPKQAYAINALGHPALDFKSEYRRVYPAGHLTSHLTGYTDIDGIGIAGMERAADNVLRTVGENIQLTIDLRVQHILHRELSAAVRKFSATAGIGMIMDVHSGEIIALSSLPDFDPHRPGHADPAQMFNRATLGVFEMGSTFKLFSTAAALDSGRVEVHHMFDAKKPIKYGRHTIRDFHAKKRNLSLPEVFIHSSNIGTARMAQKIGDQGLKDFYERLGFFEPVPVALPERGTPLYPKPWRDIHTLTGSFGHGIAVSPLHLVRASAALVNGGFLVTPRLVVDTQRPLLPQADGPQVISGKTSQQMRQLMALTVAAGSGRNAAVKGYDVGGKTGTAEKNIKGRYVKEKVMSSFLAAFPMREPRYVVLAILDEPQPTPETHGYVTGGWTAAPVVAKVIEYMAPLYGMVPDFEADGRIAAPLKKYVKEKKDVAAR